MCSREPRLRVLSTVSLLHECYGAKVRKCSAETCKDGKDGKDEEDGKDAGERSTGLTT